MAVGCCYLYEEQHEYVNSQEILNEIGPLLCQKNPFMKQLIFFYKFIIQNGCNLPLLKQRKYKKTLFNELLNGV